MQLVLLTTSTCIKCKSLKPQLEEFCNQRDIKLSQLDAMSASGRVLVENFNITQVPAIFLYGDQENLLHIFTGDIYISEIEKFLV